MPCEQRDVGASAGSSNRGTNSTTKVEKEEILAHSKNFDIYFYATGRQPLLVQKSSHSRFLPRGSPRDKNLACVACHPHFTVEQVLDSKPKLEMMKLHKAYPLLMNFYPNTLLPP